MHLQEGDVGDGFNVNGVLWRYLKRVANKYDDKLLEMKSQISAFIKEKKYDNEEINI